MFEKFLNQYKQLGKADKTIQNYLTTWTTFEKWIRLSDPDLEDAGFATQKDISDYKRYLLQHGGRNGGLYQTIDHAINICPVKRDLPFFCSEQLHTR